MELHQLFVFTKVVEHKSFSKAAEAVYLSQSTVSSHIQSLEKMLNVRLFDRVGRDTIVTPYGERLYQWALRLLELKDQALYDIKESVTDLRGKIHIGVSSVPGQFLVPKMVKKFRKEYPNVTFLISEFPSKIVAENVTSGKVDVGFLGEKYEDERLHYLPLQKEKLVVISSDEYQLDGCLSIENIVQYPFIMRKSDSGTKAILEKFLKKKNIKEEQLNIVAHTDSSQTLIEFVKQGIGIAIISEIAAREYALANNLHIHELNGFEDERYFYLVYNEAKTLSFVSRLLIEMVSKKVPC
ncbi:selenium metabolism-associated LysR family transcriptional regulator [Robertmurraya sp. DFI.2.37]|uniref:selenium metabolism-associated LysR family transcriptional regulator n=1 Tax=Robertmurraya sp. DFI.2.37 TaxID=3031819 RepID=UPI0012470C94|nr:selenium metabolism-associated LysR family transcriptional regulator [Robertmurraya sp. DFI.2.37]MDF1508096.1 selenium metabolism-associated LysR family transcriptional regulator [Robertmurraya sp. DFI.2.37]